ncbi:hypothetical protein ASD8599_01726 [Ascidiaceihabitans donghaensis]|uniref:Phage tail assembly protein n=1 Tax=Ascidiaceihabitans donghaensis TaxID=1510460 RepID=A0A2R8BD24_9RHOB|nr:hypothetical protein [Ascidiaceihabitans donghaensis]SPH20985.1 hypothetical protein ASD8599_01726 [Ascidiaceihabitans donghaensis]
MSTFTVTKNPEFTTDVEVMQPTGNGHDKKILRTRFRVVPNSEANEFDLSTFEGTQAYLDHIVITFENLVDENKDPMICDANLRSDLMDLPYIQNALVSAYTSALVGAKRGN